ncbi:MAG TPA: hypothetical protein VGY66_32755 [Gemmataceae bacterium]|jgi:hypothetical protein|nr:hypothetical protein [Gemmataceae bacterium]
MSRQLRLIVVLAFLLPSGGMPAQNEDNKALPQRNQVEVRFIDGSTVRMELLQEDLEVITKYGKLTVPAADIRNIEFGLHLSDFTVKKVQDLIARLGSKAHAEREGASKDLVLLGYEAFPALLAAVKNHDQEISRRAEEALKRIHEKVPAHLLRSNVNDRIETTEFPIVGRISSTTLKAKSAYFGEKEIRVEDLLTIYSLSAGGSHEVTIDAARYGSAANQWMDTGIEINMHTGLNVTASGQVDLQGGTGQIVTGPSGIDPRMAGGGGFVGGRAGRAMNYPGGALLGRIGDTGEVFVVGENYKGRSQRQGKLYLHIWPSPWGINSVGSYKVKITTGGLP